MNNNIKATFLRAIGLYIGVSGIGNVAVAANIDIKGINVNGVELCADIAKAGNVLKKQGFFKNQPDSYITQSVKNKMIMANKSEPGISHRFLVMSADGKGRVTTANYQVKGLTDNDALFNQTLKHIEQVIGQKLSCLEKRVGKTCQYNKGDISINVSKHFPPKSKVFVEVVGICTP